MRIAIDFDGVLHSYTSGWTGQVPYDPPVDGAQQAMAKLLEQDHKLVVFTCRINATEKDDLNSWQVHNVLRQWFRANGFPSEFWDDDKHGSAVFTTSDLVEITGTKPHADIYIDDRGMRFEGHWNDVLHDLQVETETTPWHKQPA